MLLSRFLNCKIIKSVSSLDNVPISIFILIIITTTLHLLLLFNKLFFIQDFHLDLCFYEMTWCLIEIYKSCGSGLCTGTSQALVERYVPTWTKTMNSFLNYFIVFIIFPSFTIWRCSCKSINLLNCEWDSKIRFWNGGFLWPWPFLAEKHQSCRSILTEQCNCVVILSVQGVASTFIWACDCFLSNAVLCSSN